MAATDLALTDNLTRRQCVVFDLAGVLFRDVTGAKTLEEAIERLGRRVERVGGRGPEPGP